MATFFAALSMHKTRCDEMGIHGWEVNVGKRVPTGECDSRAGFVACTALTESSPPESEKEHQ